MDLSGILIGIGTFLIIGLLHMIVIKTEYYWSKKCWPAYAVAGFICCTWSIFIENTIVSILLGVLGFALFWSIHELFEQEKRVRKGWYPSNSGRSDTE